MAFILFSVVGLACKRSRDSVPRILKTRTVVRFLGSTAYLIVRMFAGE